LPELLSHDRDAQQQPSPPSAPRYVMHVERLARHKLSEAVHGGGRDE
jgi:hypothetical protein